MKALIFHAPGRLALEDRPEPRIERPDDAIVELALAGICGTDRAIHGGRFPARAGVILGHEAVGVVRELGAAVTHLSPGDRVVIDPTLHCGVCDDCRTGRFNFCANKAGTEVGVDRDGAFARAIRLPARFLYQLPDDMAFERAVLVEPLACVLNNLEQAGVGFDDTVAVLGAGPIGLLAAMMAARRARRVLVVDTHPARVRWARRMCEHVIDGAGEPRWRETVVQANRGKPPRIVVETTGVLLTEALELVDRGGKVVLMGFNASYSATIQPLYLTNRGIHLIGAGDYNQNLQSALDVASGLPLEALISHRLPLEDHAAAFGLLDNRAPAPGDAGVMKVLFEIHA